MTALVSLLAAILVGAADFLLGVAARRSGPLSVPLVGQTCGLLMLGVSLIFVDSPVVRFEDLAWGALAGTATAAAYTLFLAAMANGQMCVIAPVAAATGAAVPAIYGIGVEEEAGTRSVLGILVAVVAIVLVSSTKPTENATSLKAIMFAALSGLFFGLFFLSLSFTSIDAGMWPLVANRAVSIPILIVVNLLTTKGIWLDRNDFKGTASAGILEMVASILILWALRNGPVSIAGVFGSLYPISTVVLAWLILGERLRRIQMCGAVLAIIATVLTAI